MYKIFSIKILLTLVLVLFSDSSITHENINHNIDASSGDKCVEPTDIMRAQHHIFVNHQSNETVVKGIRTKKYSLNNCINCHIKPLADGSYPSVKTEDHFCSACHIAAAVKVECFDCHASKPYKKVAKNKKDSSSK
tara:strand:+ start:91 stop:498 length:408 start_codon:yes stop_codon:yes gene_type:complete